MNAIESAVSRALQSAFISLFNHDPGPIPLEETRPEFDGQLTCVVFPYLKVTRLNPVVTAEKLGEALLNQGTIIERYQAINGFLNLTINTQLWIQWLNHHTLDLAFNSALDPAPRKIMVEFSSPNTNKPQHLGHVRNNLLGAAVSNLLAFCGHEVVRANLINDRGIHICKSMIAWMEFGEGITPEKAGKKGDHLVGDFYVLFDKHYKSQMEALIQQGMDRDKAEKEAPIMKAAAALLMKWEQGDPQTLAVWKTMNDWVYQGFNATYSRMGIAFDKMYYESNTYLLGKDVVTQGLNAGVFFKKDDESVWINLEDKGLDEKLLLRRDGTSVYMTQDLGTAQRKYEDFPYDQSIYVVGNEQDYHFKALKAILEKLNAPFANGIQHLSYGMVDLPSGKMKSREGTVVDADDLMDEMESTAETLAQTLGKIGEMTLDERQHLYRAVGLGALKYYLLKVNPEKRMVFNPEESIDFQGNTGAFIQYTYARIASVLRQAEPAWWADPIIHVELLDVEINLIQHLSNMAATITKAANELNPAELANYLYQLTRSYNQFYHQAVILKETDVEIRNLRLRLCLATHKALHTGLGLLGIETVERM